MRVKGKAQKSCLWTPLGVNQYQNIQFVKLLNQLPILFLSILSHIFPAFFTPFPPFPSCSVFSLPLSPLLTLVQVLCTPLHSFHFCFPSLTYPSLPFPFLPPLPHPFHPFPILFFPLLFSLSPFWPPISSIFLAFQK